MSISSLARRKSIQPQKPPILPAGIVIVVLLLFVSVWMLMSYTTVVQKARSLPAGQLQADGRTLVAAVGFLFESDTDSSGPEAPTGAAPLCASNVAVQPLTSASFCCTSNQSESFSELITNVPARS